MADHDKNHDTDALLRRAQSEFGPRRPEDDEGGISGQPTYGEAETIPPQTRYVQVQLPTGPVWAAWALLAINIGIYVLTCLLSFVVTGAPGALLNPAGGVLQLLGWKQNDLILQGQYWRLLTAMFLHGNLIHIFFNGYALFILGPEAERIYGTMRFLGLYFLAGLAGSIASYAFSASPSVGASGAIFGLIGGLAAFYYASRQALGDFGRNQLRGMVAIVIINLMIGFSAGGVIDNYAHIGGLLGGAAAGFLLAPRFAVDQRLFPPVMVRQFQPFGWIGAAAMLVLLGVLVLTINPPLLPLP